MSFQMELAVGNFITISFEEILTFPERNSILSFISFKICDDTDLSCLLTHLAPSYPTNEKKKYSLVIGGR